MVMRRSLLHRISLHTMILTSPTTPGGSIPPSMYEHGPDISRATWAAIGKRLYETEMAPVMTAATTDVISLRLDGRGFTRQLKRLMQLGYFREGYSPEFTEIMRGVLKQVMTEYDAMCGYTHSDELTVLLPSQQFTGKHPYGGRRDKLTSLTASFTSQYFTRRLIAARPALPLDVQILFDCRMAVWPDVLAAFDVVSWRAWDCCSNGVSTAVRNAHASKEVCNGHTGDKLAWLAAAGKLPLADHEAYGTFFVNVNDVITEVKGPVLRNLKNGTIKLTADLVSLSQTWWENGVR